MGDFIFHSPWAFLLLAGLPFVLEGDLRSRFLSRVGLTSFAKKKAEIKFSSIVDPKSLPLSNRLKYYEKIINAARIFAFCFLVIALARPQTGVSYTESEASGRDIMLVLDTSRSMSAMDFGFEGKRVDRLTALKAVVKDFIRRRKGDRIGLIVFGEEVFTQSPLTLDHNILEDFVAGLEVGMAGDATALGDSVAIALKRMQNIDSSSKVLVLVTDGLKTAGQIEPKDSAEIAKKLGVKIHTVGIGGSGKAPFKTLNLFGVETVQYKSVPLDEKTLQSIAETTGGKYFNAKNTEELAKVYAEIDSIEERSDTVYEYTQYSEHFWPFALWGILVLVLTELAKIFFFRVFP